jgi:DNA-binding NtrC family response regulator
VPTTTDFSPGNKTILLLVSDPLMKDVIRDALVSGGYQVVVATELGAAVDRVREVWPDLLITRPYISSMPGQTAAAYLRAKRPGLPVLIVSGFMEDDRVRDRNAIENFHIFPKPFTREDLLDTIREVFLATKRPKTPEGKPAAA